MDVITQRSIKCHRNAHRWYYNQRLTLIVFVVILLTLSSSLPPSSSGVQLVDARKGDRPRYRTAYACEGSQLQITCEDGTLIHLIRANYGRFSISICNEHGNLDWSVDCTSQRSYYVIANSCGLKKSCTLSASSSLFDDPCPGTLKYLEAHYQCIAESSSPSMKPPIPISLSTSPIPMSVSSETTPSVTTSVSQLSPPSSSPSSIPSSAESSSASDSMVTHRPPIIVPLTQLYHRSSTTTDATSGSRSSTSHDNLIPGEGKLMDTVVRAEDTVMITKQQSSASSSLNSSSSSSSVILSSHTTTKSYSLSPSSSLSSTTTVKPFTTTRASSIDQSSLRPISEVSDNHIGHASNINNGNNNNNHNNNLNPNIESETMGSIGSRSFDHQSTDSTSDDCPSVVFRDIRWPQTRVGAVTIEPCPSPTHGSAKWECARSASPSPSLGSAGSSTTSMTSWVSQPDLSDCTSFWVHNLRSRVENGDSVMSVASELAQRTRASKLYGGDIIQTTHVLQNLVSKMGSSVGDISEEKRHQLVRDLIQSVIEVSSNILESKNREAWFDLNVHSRRVVASQLIHGLENAALLLAATQNGQYDFNKAHTNVLVSVRLVDAKVSGVREMHFPTEDTVFGTAWMLMHESLTLPLQTSITSSSAKPGVLKVVFLAYRNVQDFLTPLNASPSSQSPSASQSSSSSLISPSAVSSSGVRRVINSKVMTLSLVGETNNAFNVHLAEPIQLQFKHLIEENVSHPQCVFWDFNISEWSSDGCWVLMHNKSHTLCSCNHLTSFALLMDINSGKVSEIKEDSSRFVVYIGSIVVLAFIVLTFTILIFVRSWRRLLLLVCLFQTLTWSTGACYLRFEAPLLGYLFIVLNVIQAILLLVYCCTKYDKIRAGVRKSLSRTTWLPECIRGAKPPPPDGITDQTGQTAQHLFSITTPNGLLPPPSPLIRPSQHHHQHHHQKQIHGSLQQLSVGTDSSLGTQSMNMLSQSQIALNQTLISTLCQSQTLNQLIPYNDQSLNQNQHLNHHLTYQSPPTGAEPPQYVDQHMDTVHKSVGTVPDITQIQSQTKNNTGFITHGPRSITHDVHHLTDSTSYQTYSPSLASFHNNNKSLVRRSLRTSAPGSASLERQQYHHQHNQPSDESNDRSLHVSNMNHVYGGNGQRKTRRDMVGIYPGKHGYQISPEVAPLRPPLPDHIYECIDDDCYYNGSSSGSRRNNNGPVNKFYREFESPARIARPPPLRSATLAPAFCDPNYHGHSSGGSERNLLRTIAASVLNSSSNNCNNTNDGTNFTDFLLDNSSIMNDCVGNDHMSASNDAIALTSSTSGNSSASASECSIVEDDDDDPSTDDSNQSESIQCGTGISSASIATPNSLTNRSVASDNKVINNLHHHHRHQKKNRNYSQRQSEPSSPSSSRHRYDDNNSSVLIKLSDSGDDRMQFSGQFI